MQNHTKVYMNFFYYGVEDFVPCEMCEAKAVDIHHIEKRNKTKNDYIENLIGLCRDCHIKAESDTCFNMFCRIRHLENVCVQVYALINLNNKLKNGN
jgi:5-methylcytosine-specific restriction endonuclease McrA